MNILHIKYAVEVAKLGSVSKATETLFTAQPNISRSIRELENDLGIEIFSRSAKGMVLTPEGEEFIGYAKGILKQIDQVETIYKENSPQKQRFSISVPRACYISEAFAQFSKTLTDSPAEIFYKETNSGRTITNIIENDYKLGIIRYAQMHDHHFKEMLEEKGLSYEMVAEFSYQVIMSRENPLAYKDEITLNDLTSFIEINHADPYVPSLPLSKIIKEELPDRIERRIFIFERGSQFDLLSENPNTFMWVSPASEKVLQRYNLIQRPCVDNDKRYKDVLIYRNGYRLTQLDKNFITALIESRRKYLP